MMTASSASQSTLSDTAGSTMSSSAPISDGAVLGEDGRILGDLLTDLGEVAAVVEADADDLVGPWHERRVVELVEGDQPAATEGPVPPLGVGQQLADVGGVEHRRRLVVDSGRTVRAADVDRCQPHDAPINGR